MDKILRVLIVEDSEDDALLLLRDLRRGGHEPQFERVETAAAMKSALDRQTWDVVLSDFSLPHLDAPAALDILKDSGLDIPFIIVSGTIGEDAAVASLKAGAHDFIAKGNTTRLIPAIERELREAENRRNRRRVEAELSRKSLFMELLQVIAVAANVSSSVEEVLQFALDKVCVYLAWSVGHVYIPDKTTGEFVSSHVWYLDSPDQFQSFRSVTETSQIAPKVGLIGRIADKRQPIWIVDIAEHNLFTRSKQAGECGLRGVLALPVLVGDEVVAVLEFYTIEAIQVDELLLEEMANIGIQLGQVFERQQNEKVLKSYNERLKTLHAIDRAILTMQSSETVAELVLGSIRQQVNASRVGVTLLNFETREAQELATYSVQETQLPVGARFPLAGFPDDIFARLRDGDVFEVKDLASLRHTNPMIPMLEAEGLRSAVSIPLRVDGQLIGTLNLGAGTPNGFSSAQIEIASELAGQLAIAIQQASYREQIDRHVTELEERVLERTGELLRTKNRIETILNSSSDAIFLATFDGVIQQINPAVGDLFGYSIDDLFGQSLIMLTAPDSLERSLETMVTVIKAVQPCTIELLARRKDGSTFDSELALSPVIEDSIIKGIVGILRDITTRKQAEAALQASEAKYRALVNFAPDLIVIVNDTGHIVLVNEQVKKFTGYEQQELVGQFIEVLLPDHIRDIHLTHRAGYMAAPTTRSMGENLDLIIRHKNGLETPVTIGLSLIQTGDEQLVMAYIVDVTAQKQLEASLRAALAQEKELSELRTRFISMVSHDFRTPLSVIRSSTETLQRYHDRLDEAQKAKKFNNIQTQIDRMVVLLNDVLIISRADAGKIPFNPVLLNLDQFCRSLADEFQSAPDMKHTLLYTCSGEPIEVPIDEKLLQQAIINLLTNAFKYSPEGGGVYLDLAFDKGNAIIRVKDSGIGIPEADQPRLFETFHRAGNVGTIEGTGLGLAIVKRSVNAHGGSIAFESQMGVGTTFTITLPLQQIQETNS